jgi:hypothetical protein
MTEQELIELLADKEHASWARWMRYQFARCRRGRNGELIIPADLYEQWGRQAGTPYDRLSEHEKQYDRDEVAQILPIIRKFAGTSDAD